MTDDADVIELIDTDKLTIRAWLMGKMQTSLMRDGWGIAKVDQANGVLTVVDGLLHFTISLSIPEETVIVPTEVPRPAKKTAREHDRAMQTARYAPQLDDERLAAVWKRLDALEAKASPRKRTAATSRRR